MREPHYCGSPDCPGARTWHGYRVCDDIASQRRAALQVLELETVPLYRRVQAAYAVADDELRAAFISECTDRRVACGITNGPEVAAQAHALSWMLRDGARGIPPTAQNFNHAVSVTRGLPSAQPSSPKQPSPNRVKGNSHE